MDNQLLLDTGLEYDINDFSKKSIVLRDGRESVLWVHEPTGHGILDRKYWENIDEDYYKEDYRQQSSTNAKGGFVEPREHLSICEKLNKRQYEQFSDRVNKDTKYLEVGCSFGGVAKNVLDFGVEVCDVVEPNKVDAEFIKENFDGITVYNDLLENVNIDKKYNLVVSFEVLEHAISPIEFLKKCNNLK